MLAYLIQSTACMAFFYAIYYFLLRKETYFQSNRWYLLLTLIISFMLPFIKISFEASASASPILLPSAYIGSYVASLESSPREAAFMHPIFSWPAILMAVYVTVVAFLLRRFGLAIHEILGIKRNSTKTVVLGQNCLLSQQVKIPFAFFNTLYLPVQHNFSEEELLKVIRHEQAHAEGRHTLDILFVELACIFFWFNPLVYLYRKSLREVHEFVADAQVLKDTPWEQYASILVQQQGRALQPMLSHALIYSQLKNRLHMMNRNRSGVWASFKFLVFIPVFFAVLLLFSFRGKDVMFEKKVYNLYEDGLKMTFLPSNEPGTDTLPTSSENEIRMKPTNQVGEANTHEQSVQYEWELPRTFVTAIRLNPSDSAEKTKESENDNLLGYERELPIFPGCEAVAFADQGMCGMMKLQAYINSHLIYPEVIKTAGIEGRVVARFVVGADGYVKDIAIVDSLHPAADNAVLLLLSGMNWNAGKWLPARRGGKSMDAELHLPVLFTASGLENNPQVRTSADEMPRFPGCEHMQDLDQRDQCANEAMFKFIYTNISYPKEDRENGVEGMGVARFTITTNGSIDNIEILRSPSSSIKREITRVIELMSQLPDKWVPAKQDGKPVAFQMTLPIKFQLEEQKSHPINEAQQDPTSTPQIKLSPNPATDHIWVEVFEGASQIEVFDQSGKMVLTGKIADKGQLVDFSVSDFLPGQYVVRINSETQTATASFTVVR